MNNKYLNKIIKPYEKSFNKTELSIATYLIDSGQDVINKTISSLSQDIGVSESTIFKFVKKIGFKGFQDFKISMASNYNTNNDSPYSAKNFSDVTEKDTTPDIIEKVIVPQIGLLDYLMKNLDSKKLDQAVELVHSSDLLLFSGQGGSSIIAYDSYHKFLRTKFNCIYISDFHMQLTYAKKTNKKSLAFLFSHSGETEEIITLAKQLKENDSKIISLTGNHGTELEKISDITFVISSEESILRSETLTSRILYMTLIDILYVIIMYRDKLYNEKSLDVSQDMEYWETGD